MAIMNNSYHPHYHTPKLIATGIGLGIVAALDVKPSSTELLIKHPMISSPRSVPIPVTRTHVPQSDMDYEDDDEDENFTYVTSRGPTNNSVTRVYHDRPPGHGGVLTPPTAFVKSSNIDDDNDNNNNNNKSDFLSSCDLCCKSLEGKDIYIYRGEKAFCSGECRERQISIDERKDKMSRSAKRMMTSSTEMVVSRSPCYYETGQIFTTGIIATY